MAQTRAGTQTATTTTDAAPTGKSLRGNAKHAGLPAHLRKAAVFRRIADRVGVTVHGDRAKDKGSSEMDGWVDNETLATAKQEADQAIALLTAAADRLEALGTTFQPSEKRARSSRARKLDAGARVKMREKPRESYAELMTPEEMDDLEVVRHAGTKVLCKTSSGAKLLLARGHIELIGGEPDDEPEDDEPEETEDDEPSDDEE